MKTYRLPLYTQMSVVVLLPSQSIGLTRWAKTKLGAGLSTDLRNSRWVKTIIGHRVSFTSRYNPRSCQVYHTYEMYRRCILSPTEAEWNDMSAPAVDPGVSCRSTPVVDILYPPHRISLSLGGRTPGLELGQLATSAIPVGSKLICRFISTTRQNPRSRQVYVLRMNNAMCFVCPTQVG